jgi:hypothetical protein
MARYRSSKEVRNQHLDMLGPNLGPVYDALYNECLWLHFKWHQFVELYGSTTERIDLLNRAASRFFLHIQDTLWQDTLLHLTRLTDRGDFNGKKNLTVQSLPNLISDLKFRDEIQHLVDEAVKATAFARDWRNRRIAHRDLALTLNKGAKPLANASRKHVTEALRAVCRIIERVNEFYLKSYLSLDLVTKTITDDAVSLLYVIRDGLDAEQKLQQRVRNRKLEPEDLRPRPKI